MAHITRKPARLALAAVTGLLLSACAPMAEVQLAMSDLVRGPGTPQTVTLRDPLRPAAKPAAPLGAGMEVRNLLTGERQTMRVTRLGADAVRVHQDDGCVWTRWGDWFAPSDSWAGCGESRNWHTGRATVRPIGSLWPLAEGNVARFERSAVSHTGRANERQTVCRVKDTVAVVRERAGTTPAFVVECSDGKRTRTTWYAPGEGPVAFRKAHEEKGVEEAWVRL